MIPSFRFNLLFSVSLAFRYQEQNIIADFNRQLSDVKG